MKWLVSRFFHEGTAQAQSRTLTVYRSARSRSQPADWDDEEDDDKKYVPRFLEAPRAQA